MGGGAARDGTVIMLSQKNRIRLIRVGEEEARVVKVCIRPESKCTTG